MGRLITEETVIDVLKQTGIIADNELGHCVMHEISRIPTAYDVDKVVEVLKLHRDCYERKTAEYDEKGDTQNMDISDSISLAYGKAIEIVRKGGVNE